MENVAGNIGIIIVVLFFSFETINWFLLQSLRLKVKYQKGPCTQEQANRILKQIRLIYFWLSSDYYFKRLRELYILVCQSPEVSVETKKGMYKSLSRRFVSGLKKVYE